MTARGDDVDDFDDSEDGNEERRWPGKYRGVVVDNKDSDNLGQLNVLVPAVLPNAPFWARPATPYAGKDTTRVVGWFVLPPINANVWVEFEGGDLDSPIWSGGFWLDDAFTPPSDQSADDPSQVKMLQTDTFGLTIDDNQDTGSARIELLSPAVTEAVTILLDATGLTITCKDCKMVLGSDDTLLLQVTDNNSITITQDGITITTAKLGVDVTGDIDVSAGGNISVEASGNLSLKGAATSVSGQSLELSSSGTLSAKASGPLSLSGATISIN